MRSTANSRTATAQATGVLIAGIASTAYSAYHNHLAGSITGACLVISALTWVSLIRIKQWVTNTSNERRTLAEATRAADEERNRYVAAQAAAEIEHSRRQQDLAAERASIEARLTAERAKMRRDFEDERAQIMRDAFRTGVEMERAGMLKPDAPQIGNLIQFPKDLPTQQRERSREHGVVGP
ncbi:hypothetical protein [Streptomyces canus]|uniref:hypothetical protein n=1 Tax=Streptomyces canus TaxID=58343 RepID=UPI001319C038|nr:hypothetical protein [Streptomyces canus]